MIFGVAPYNAPFLFHRFASITKRLPSWLNGRPLLVSSRPRSSQRRHNRRPGHANERPPLEDFQQALTLVRHGEGVKTFDPSNT